ncbi:putative CDC16 [Trypanosoma rangeli]|uniref:Putative CDC16 n=1 Tax=Trypanosoma rangeli TaxID=5698 RepID=A0A422P591_TRYRA|nr:putative CDC16 [Trypanosoma rangeli]RNF12889.1 putative CDC16 [Trypanosoma rangeli]|eukprot:RNF12889.1 putative CDC16 [Trypanosoma rangeli]
MRCGLRSLIMLCLLLLFVAARVGTASFVAEWNPETAVDEETYSAQLAALPQFDATGWTKKADSRCGVEPAFPVNRQVLVKVQTATGERQFVLYIPASYTRRGNSKVALQLLFHGLSDSCGGFLNATGLVEYADRDGFIVASLCGSRGLVGVGWNSGTCCGFLVPDRPDDFEFTEKVLDVVAAGACIDRTKVMAVGFSNGAMMAEVLGCEKPKLIRAVASVGGIVELRPGNEAGLEVCGRDIRSDNPDGRRPSILMVHGNLDLIVPVIGNKLLGFPPLKDNVAAWASFNGCGANANVTLNVTKYTNEVYTDCDSAAAASEPRMRRYLFRARNVVKGRLTGLNMASLGHSIVEVVHALYAGHSWPEDGEFSTRNYIYEFGKRVFSSY